MNLSLDHPLSHVLSRVLRDILALEAWFTIPFLYGLYDRLYGSSSTWSLSLIWLIVGLLGRNFGQF